ncbi:MAG: hypothetical protein AAF513_01805 [Pseudomonadota bacterium]
MDNFDWSTLTGTWIGILILIVVAIWTILMILAPFFWYGAWARAKECSHKLDTLIRLKQAELDQAQRTG